VAPLKENGILHSNSRDKAEILNRQFDSVFTNEDTDNIPTLPGEKTPLISDLTIQVPGVQKLLSQLNANKAAGPDSVTCRILKELATELAPATTALFNQSLSSGRIPEDWARANITPIFKKGNHNQAENYRPVSLTCVCCKLLEHIVCKHMLNHLEQHRVLTPLQHGFRSAHSCESQLLITAHNLMQARKNGTQLDIAILDFSKAFDTVPHERLLSKLEHYGIDGAILQWIRSFLTTRYQHVVVDGVQSEWVKVRSGVPQGTVLGPLLFLLHINDLPNNITSQARLFADDCLVYRPIKCLEDQLALQRDLDTLVNWADTWGMRFNPSKCNIMRISKTSKPLERMYTMCGTVISQVQDAKYLGVNINENLTWSNHISKVCSKANSTLGFLRRNLRVCPEGLRETAYFALVRSTLDYSCTIWDPYLKKDIQSLEKVQRRAARFVKHKYSWDDGSVSAMVQELRWTSLKSIEKISDWH
jgi:hypothetical protein